MRLQLALNVRDIEESITYYSKLFDSKPHKRRAGYANFAIDNPPLKLVLFENPNADERVNHLGVELSDTENLRDITERLENSGISEKIENQATCCFAIQNKIWSIEPQGLRWEWYTITDDNPKETNNSESGVCCA